MRLLGAMVLVVVVAVNDAEKQEISSPSCPCYIDNESNTADCSSRNLAVIPNCVPSTTKRLNLANNDLRYHPKQFQRLKSLQHLDLSDNYLFNPENDSFLLLKELRVLYLNNTDYLYLQNNAFNGLSQLETLSLRGSKNSRQHLTLPEGIFDQLQGLSHLDLSYKVLKINDFQFAQLRNLVFLDISHCVIPYLDERKFSGLSSLKVLSLANSQWFTNEMTPDLFTSLIALKELHIDGFCFDVFLNCSKIDSIFPKVTTLERLYIHNSILVYTIGPGFSVLDHLKELYIVSSADLLHEPRCTLEVLDKHTLNHLIKTPLSKLAIHDCDVDFIQTNTFAQFNNLSSLDVVLSSRWCNRIFYYIGQGMVQTKIHTLRLSLRCRFYWNLPHEPLLIGLEYTGLEYLDLSDGPAETLDYRFFGCLPKTLTHLYLKNNRISSIRVELLQPLNRLLFLDLSFQQETVPCESCLILHVKKCYPFPYSLLSLDTSNNGLFCMLTEGFCAQNLSLKILHAANLRNFNCLQTFWKKLKNLKALEELDFSGNFIKEIPLDAFSEQKNIKRILLVRNYLLEIAFDCEHLTSLQYIDLKNNTIMSAAETFTGSIDRVASNITIISLDNNRLVCDCQHRHFVAWLRGTTAIQNKDRLSCTFSNGTELSLSRVSDIHERLQNECIVLEVTLGCIGVFILQYLILIIATLACHNRWKFNYLLAVGRRTVNPYHPLEDAIIEMEYDVYISYDRDYEVTPGEDLHAFVANKLYPGLRQRGFRVLIRDELEIGRRLYEVISNAIRKSDKVLVLLSKGYCSDSWNVFEFNMAAMEGIYTKRQVVIPIAFENVDQTDLHDEVRAFLECQSIPAYTKNSRITEQDFIDYISKLIRDNRPFD